MKKKSFFTKEKKRKKENSLEELLSPSFLELTSPSELPDEVVQEQK
jgi:hypothetical protein